MTSGTHYSQYDIMQHISPVISPSSAEFSAVLDSFFAAGFTVVILIPPQVLLYPSSDTSELLSDTPAWSVGVDLAGPLSVELKESSPLLAPLLMPV